MNKSPYQRSSKHKEEANPKTFSFSSEPSPVAVAAPKEDTVDVFYKLIYPKRDTFLLHSCSREMKARRDLNKLYNAIHGLAECQMREDIKYATSQNIVNDLLSDDRSKLVEN